MNNVKKVKKFLEERGLLGNYLEFSESSATVELAAQRLNCETGRIAKSLTFITAKGPVIVVAMGMAKVDNRKFKDFFKQKACLAKPDTLLDLVGHPMGGVCPFALRPGVEVFLDQSLRLFDPVYPAAGAPNNMVRLSLAELEDLTDAAWIDVCKFEQNERQGESGN